MQLLSEQRSKTAAWSEEYSQSQHIIRFMQGIYYEWLTSTVL